jgi:hypothetical protein
MRRCAVIAVLAMSTLVPFGAGSPINGTYSDKNEILSQPWQTTRTFQGGERASVIALGNRADNELIGKISIKILDAKGNLVVEDNGSNNLTGDFVGVAWYPPRTAEYRIEVHSDKANKVWIAIK